MFLATLLIHGSTKVQHRDILVTDINRNVNDELFHLISHCGPHQTPKWVSNELEDLGFE